MSMATIRKEAFDAVLAVCGCSPALFDSSDGTSKREAVRNFLHGTVKPLGRLLEEELTAKLETEVRLNYDNLYMHDLAGRAAAFQKYVAGGMDVAKALALTGMMVPDDDA